MRCILVWALFAVSIVHLATCYFDRDVEQIVVQTDLGRIRGNRMVAKRGTWFIAFRGIRYAKAPVRDLRFKAPVPVEPWERVFDATREGPMCPQPTANVSDVSEDCLRLNVYTQRLPNDLIPAAYQKRPVIVYLHPGGFYSLSGQSKNFAGPQLIMDRDIVFVTLNYRLGSLGFLATGTADAPGNAGLKDQVLALQWIKTHIRKFGGDPDSITVMGYGAGAVSITLHMVSPMSQGLFHKAIVMSGSSLSQTVLPNHQTHIAQRQARAVNCPDDDIPTMMACLRKKSALELGNSLPSMFEFGTNPVLIWSPVLEPDLGQERFLTEPVTPLYQYGEFMKIPIIAGISKDEFVDPAINILTNETMRQQMDQEWDRLAPICFVYDSDSPRTANISAELRKFYLGEGELNPQTSLEGLAHLFADSLTGFAMNRFVNLAARYTKVYQYRFSYQGRWSHTYYPDDKPYGVVHHDELMYLLNGPNIEPDTPEYLTVERLTRMWENFAENTDPNNPSDEYFRDMRWRTFDHRRKPYMDISSDLEMKLRLYGERYSKWNELFPLKWKVQPYNEDYPAVFY